MAPPQHMSCKIRFGVPWLWYTALQCSNEQVKYTDETEMGEIPTNQDLTSNIPAPFHLLAQIANDPMVHTNLLVTYLL